MPAKQSLLQWPTAAPADEADGRKPSHAAAAAQLGRRRRYSAAAQLTLAGSIRCYECCALMSQPCHTLQRAMLCQRHSGTHKFASTDAENGQGKDLVPRTQWRRGRHHGRAAPIAQAQSRMRPSRPLAARSTCLPWCESCGGGQQMQSLSRPARCVRAFRPKHTHTVLRNGRVVWRGKGGQRLRSGRTACAVSGTSVWSCGAKVASCTQRASLSRAPRFTSQ